MQKIVSYQECECGAVTLIFADGQTNHCKRRNLSKFGISLRGVKKDPIKVYMCDHCINHYGIDICSCGSGKAVGKCSCGSSSPMEELGTEFDGFSRILQNFAR